MSNPICERCGDNFYKTDKQTSTAYCATCGKKRPSRDVEVAAPLVGVRLRNYKTGSKKQREFKRKRKKKEIKKLRRNY